MKEFHSKDKNFIDKYGIDRWILCYNHLKKLYLMYGSCIIPRNVIYEKPYPPEFINFGYPHYYDNEYRWEEYIISKRFIEFMSEYESCNNR